MNPVELITVSAVSKGWNVAAKFAMIWTWKSEWKHMMRLLRLAKKLQRITLKSEECFVSELCQEWEYMMGMRRLYFSEPAYLYTPMMSEGDRLYWSYRFSSCRSCENFVTEYTKLQIYTGSTASTHRLLTEYGMKGWHKVLSVFSVERKHLDELTSFLDVIELHLVHRELRHSAPLSKRSSKSRIPRNYSKGDEKLDFEKNTLRKKEKHKMQPCAKHPQKFTKARR